MPDVLSTLHPLTRQPLDPADLDGVIQAVRFELYRDNVFGALDVVESAVRLHPHRRYRDEVERIRSWLHHLQDRATYTAIHEQQYRALRWKPGLKLLEWARALRKRR